MLSPSRLRCTNPTSPRPGFRNFGSLPAQPLVASLTRRKRGCSACSPRPQVLTAFVADNGGCKRSKALPADDRCPRVLPGRNALCAMHAQMLADPVGQRILRERPRVRSSHIDMDCLRLFPEDSFGFAYARFMDENGFDLDDHRTTEYVDDVELACVMQRQRELHDVQHVMFGVPPTVFGEVTLKHLEYAHTGLPSAMIISQLGWFKLSPDEKRLAATEFVPWARRAGRNARAFVTVASEDEFAPLLEELREKLNIEVAPRLSAAK
ncbi:hypothetical protein PybrP1_007418 [[Pythium] brassicae (nom. inval.)]|nr:hypothetical protein PybrP1_007418 [[Pythium] brassicae (nom. inval.)]